MGSHEAHLRLIDRLISLGAEVDARDVRGRTPLIKSAILGNTSILNHLHLTHGADITAKSDAELDEGGISASDYFSISSRPLGGFYVVSFKSSGSPSGLFIDSASTGLG